MEKLSRDALFSIAIELDLPDLLKFCSSSKRINDLVCKKNDIWLYKLTREFPDCKDFKINNKIKSYRDVYILLYKLTELKRKLNRKESILELYNLQRLDLSYNYITEIPKEIGQLVNLRRLYLSNNQITEIPKEISQLFNLQTLNLHNNKITEIRKEIGQLVNLQELVLSDNQITEIPKEIGQLVNLKYLYFNSKITEIPKEVKMLSNLRLMSCSELN